MKQRLLWTVIMILLSSSAFAATKQELKDAIESKYQLTTRSMLTGQVKKPGTVLYVARPGIQANKPSTVAKATVIEDGEIEALGGGSIIPGDAGKTLDVGEEMYLYNYQIKDDSVTFLYGTVQSYEMQVGNSRKMRPYQLGLQFRYSGGLNAVEPDRVLDDISAFFSTAKEAVTSDENTLRLGQTMEEVAVIMGPPKKKVDLGSKVIYTYDDLKIVFEDGVVSDVQ